MYYAVVKGSKGDLKACGLWLEKPLSTNGDECALSARTRRRRYRSESFASSCELFAEDVSLF